MDTIKKIEIYAVVNGEKKLQPLFAEVNPVEVYSRPAGRAKVLAAFNAPAVVEFALPFFVREHATAIKTHVKNATWDAIFRRWYAPASKENLAALRALGFEVDESF